MKQSSNSSRPPYGVIVVLLIGAFIALLNNTLLGIALPAIMTDLQLEAATAQWLSTGYMLVVGILVPATAYLIQKYSVRRLFLVAMGLFTFGTLLAGVAQDFPLLLGGRIVQASGAAVMSPLLMNVMLVSFPIEKRGTAMGLMGLVMMGAPAVGPLLSGWVVQYYEWRMLFQIITPVAILVFIAGVFLIKDKKEEVSIRIDVLSLIFSSIGFGGILYGFSSAGSVGWNHPVVYVTIIVGILSLITFIVKQQRNENPMLNFNVFRIPMFSLSITITMIVAMALFSSMIMVPIYLIDLRGISPMEAGVMMLPGALALAIMSPFVGKLFDKFGGRILAFIGLVIVTITSFYFSRLTFEASYIYLIFLNTTRTVGISMVMMPVSTNGLNHLPERLYPHGTAMNNTMQQVSGAIGTAILVAIMSIRTQTHAETMTASIPLNTTTSEELVKLNEQIMGKAMLAGINDAFFVSVFFSAVALVLALFMKRAKPANEPLEEDTIVKKAAEN
ncbi:DHA2 family efflux MFS transporter permease subunit [Halalkalibacter urbisdiaboli]|uniref:DHA2 family efflux MFS transporter permease subunit n=1 Tax=Halalkalibacter urbisdiaboli TaxID=1960589 RepID=UPI000B44DFCB|nr:DHA2 family efflux MFS transporter permease subunit [Halalkalibacter urbisdiaboli]